MDNHNPTGLLSTLTDEQQLRGYQALSQNLWLREITERLKLEQRDLDLIIFETDVNTNEHFKAVGKRTGLLRFNTLLHELMMELQNQIKENTNENPKEQ